jgi:hypothetical protein
VFSVGCLILGHDDMMVRAPDRLWLRCQHCGRDTPGWTIGPETTLVQRAASSDRRQASSFLPSARTPQVVSLTPHR